MPAKSQAEQKFMGAALERKREGHPRPGDPKMSEGQLKDFASTKRAGLPLHKKEKGALHHSNLPKHIMRPHTIGSKNPHKNHAGGRM